jgi:hypothetical protein
MATLLFFVFIPSVFALLLISSQIAAGVVATVIAGISTTVLLIPLLASWLFLGSRIYVWLDQNNRLHIHRGSWWRGLAGNNVEVQKRIPESNVLSLWLGPWPCRSRVLGEICSASILWKIKVRDRWSFFPSLRRDLVLFDACGFSLQMPLFEETSRGIAWHTNNISLVLKTIGQRQCLDEVLRVAIKEDQDSDSPVAGNIGTG